MKNILLIICSTILLQACVSPTNDMLNNKFVEVSPTSQTITGVWTGTMGPYLLSYKINSDGTGYSCYSYNTAEVTSKIKINNDMIYLSDGTRLKIEKITNSDLLLKNFYLGLNKNYRFIKDDDFKNASDYCQKALK